MNADYAKGRLTPERAWELLTYLFESCGYEVKQLTLRRRLIGWMAQATLSDPEKGYICVGGVVSHEYDTVPRWAPTLTLLVGRMASIYRPDPPPIGSPEEGV